VIQARGPGLRLACALVAGAAAGLAARRLPRTRRVRVEGASMLPTLEPGDRLLIVRPRGGHARPIEVGDLVVTADPRQATRLMVKRVAAVDGLMAELVGDNAEASTDSSVFGRVAVSDVQGRAVYRYGPVQRAGWLEPRRRRRRAGTIAGAWPSPE